MNQQQLDQMAKGRGFVAALDQSGGSTPKALRLYGIEESSYSGDAQMFDLVHAMRARIVTSPAFSGQRVIGAILFEMTMDRQFDGLDAADYLWQKKQVVPFLKVDKGLADESDGVQLMKPMPALDALLQRAVDGTVQEVILATGFSAEGEATAYALGEALRARGLRVTRLARGVPVGSELEYVDLGTIAHALADRR